MQLGSLPEFHTDRPPAQFPEECHAPLKGHKLGLHWLHCSGRPGLPNYQNGPEALT